VRDGFVYEPELARTLGVEMLAAGVVGERALIAQAPRERP
jgi:hypothetical protein